MEIGELTFIVFCSLAAINAMIFAVYVAFKREKNVYAASLMSLFLVMTAYRIIQMLLHDLQEDFNIGVNLGSLFLFIPTFPLAGPFLYLYIKSVSRRDFIFRMTHLLHLLPFLLVLLLDLHNRDKFLMTDPDHKFFKIYSIEVSLILMQFLAYIIMSFKYVQDLSKKATDESSRKNILDQGLLKKIIFSISGIWLIYALYCVQIFISKYLSAIVIESFYYSILSYLILFSEIGSRKISFLNNPAARYRTSGLSRDDAAMYKSMILEYITVNELYKDHNINLVKFSKGISLTPHIVSQVINEHLNCNFNDFINNYRIEEAKKMLKDTAMKNYTIASIAYDCGFNTLSAFNTAFKKFTGVTPSQFRTK